MPTMNHPLTRGLELQKAICEALGIDLHRTSRIVLDLRAGQAPRIRISQFMDVDQEKSVIERVFSLDEHWQEDK